MSDVKKMLAVVRIRGNIGVRREFKDALKILRLRDMNNCVVVPDNPSNRGMMKKVRNYVTFGEINFESFLAMLGKRGRVKGKRLDGNTVKETGYDSVEQLAKEIFEGKAKLKKVDSLEPVFRLTPPSGGFKSTRTHYPKGDLGYRGDAINDLIKRMI